MQPIYRAMCYVSLCILVLHEREYSNYLHTPRTLAASPCCFIDMGRVSRPLSFIQEQKPGFFEQILSILREIEAVQWEWKWMWRKTVGRLQTPRRAWRPKASCPGRKGSLVDGKQQEFAFHAARGPGAAQHHLVEARRRSDSYVWFSPHGDYGWRASTSLHWPSERTKDSKERGSVFLCGVWCSPRLHGASWLAVIQKASIRIRQTFSCGSKTPSGSEGRGDLLAYIRSENPT